MSVALVGYTNAGKSSILRALTGEHDIFVENRLFATLDTLTREIDLGEGVRVRMTDTVGFIRKLPHHLVASFRATLEEAGEADLLLHVVDASHPEWEEHVAVVEGVLSDLGLAERPVLPVFNKMDAVPDAMSFADAAPGPSIPRRCSPRPCAPMAWSPSSRCSGSAGRCAVPPCGCSSPPPTGPAWRRCTGRAR